MKKSKFFKYFVPDENFVQKTKRIFLLAFKEKYPEPQIELRPVYAYRYFFRGIVAGVAVMVIIGATSTYAYQKDVGPENVLYPLKLSQENIRAYLTPTPKKPTVHLELAEKRLKEVETLKAKNIDGEKAERVTENLRSEVRKSLRTLKTRGTRPAGTKPENSAQTQQLKKSAGTEAENEIETENEVEKDNQVNHNPEASTSIPFGIEGSGVESVELKNNKNLGNPKDESTEFCKKLNRLINSDLLEIKRKFSDDKEIIERFRDECER